MHFQPWTTMGLSEKSPPSPFFPMCVSWCINHTPPTAWLSMARVSSGMLGTPIFEAQRPCLHRRWDSSCTAFLGRRGWSFHVGISCSLANPVLKTTSKNINKPHTIPYIVVECCRSILYETMSFLLKGNLKKRRHSDFHQYMEWCNDRLWQPIAQVPSRVRLAFALTQDKSTKTNWSVGDHVQLIPEKMLIQLRCASHSWRTWQISKTSGTSNQDQSQRRTYTAEMHKMGYSMDSMVLQNNHYHPFIHIVFFRGYIYIMNYMKQITYSLHINFPQVVSPTPFLQVQGASLFSKCSKRALCRSSSWMLRDRRIVLFFQLASFRWKKRGLPWICALNQSIDILWHIHIRCFFRILRTTGKKRIRNWLLRPMNIFWGNICLMGKHEGNSWFPDVSRSLSFTNPICRFFLFQPPNDGPDFQARPAAVLEVTPAAPSGFQWRLTGDEMSMCWYYLVLSYGW